MGKETSPVMEFKFNFGKKKPTIFRLALIGVILTSVVAGLSYCSGVDETRIYDLVDEIQRKYFPQTDLNDYIIKDDALLRRRIKRDVDRAIEDYWNQLPPDHTLKPRYHELPPDGSEAQKLLGGEMRLCASWVPDCPEENQK
jgi:hypothetical protein